MSSRSIFIVLFSFFAFNTFAQQCTKTIIYFDFDKSDLKKTERKKIDSLVKAIDTTYYLVEMTGHTDSVNTEEFNTKLAAARLKTVENYLKSKKKKNLV